MKSHKPQVSRNKNPKISRHNPGFRDFTYRTYRTYKTYKSAVSAVSAVSVLACVIALTGCKATEEIAKGIATKNTSGNGTVVDTHIGINTETKIPEVRTLFISGDFATVKAGTNAVSYREESSSSVWNASSVTRKRFLSITLTDPGDVPAAIKAVAEVFKTAEAAAAADVKKAEDANKTAAE